MPTIYDQDGNPVRTGELKREHAAARIGSVRSAHRQGVASYLTPARMGRLMRDLDQGDTGAFLTLADEMEERELHYRSVLGTRKMGVTGAPVVVEAVSEDAKDQEIADAIRADIVERPEFECLAFDALDALGKGFSVNEILWDTSGKRWFPRGYRRRDPIWFRWDDDTLSKMSLADEKDTVNGIPLEPFKFVVHRPKLKSGLSIRSGLARVAAVAYMMKSFTVRDWHAFLEVFGMPLRLGKFDQSATEAEKDTLLAAVTNIAFDAAAIVPESMKIEFIEASKANGGHMLFQGAADWWDRQVSKVVLGQTMTTDDGSSRAQAEVHDGVKHTIVKADSRQLSATLNRDLVRPYVDLNYGPQERYPHVRIQVEEPEDLEAGSRTVKTLADAGVTIPVKWIRDKFGIPDPEEGEEVIGGKPASPDPQPPTPPDGPPEDPADPTDESELNTAMRAFVKALNRRRSPDAIDVLVDEALGDWEPMLDGNVATLVRLAEGAGSFENFRAALQRVSPDLDIDGVTEALAVAVFKARGMGDATDKT